MLRILDSLDDHTSEVVSKSIAALGVKVLGMGASFTLSILLARTLGADGLGVINLANTITSLLLVLCMLGTRQIIVKEVAIGLSRKDFKHIGCTLKSAFFLNIGFTLIISIGLILLTPYLVETIFDDQRLKCPLIIALVVITAQVTSRILGSALVGYRKIWQSNLVEESLSVVVTLFSLGLLWFLEFEITIIKTALAYGLGRIAVTATICIYWNSLKTKVPKTRINSLSLFHTSYPLLISSISNVLISNADVILLGIFLEARFVGLYTVASRLAMLSNFLLKITNTALSGNLASLYEQGRKEELQILIQKITLYLTVIGAGSLILYYYLGSVMLSLWGEEFEQAYILLIILSLGQFFNVASGAAGQLLIMCGFHRQQSIITTSFMVINITLNLILIHFYGVIGAALTTMITVAGVNIVRVIVARKETGILTLPVIIKI